MKITVTFTESEHARLKVVAKYAGLPPGRFLHFIATGPWLEAIHENEVTGKLDAFLRELKGPKAPNHSVARGE